MRDMTVDAQFALESTQVRPVFLLRMDFANEEVFAHTGVGDLVWAGNTYKGVGQFASISTIGESSDTQAQGITIGLSGITLSSGLPPYLFNDATLFSVTHLNATLSLGFLLNNGTLLADPIVAYTGLCDSPTVDVSSDTFSISIAIENRLSDLQRARGGRYTDADQKARHPTDNALSNVQYLNDLFINWRGK